MPNDLTLSESDLDSLAMHLAPRLVPTIRNAAVTSILRVVSEVVTGDLVLTPEHATEQLLAALTDHDDDITNDTGEITVGRIHD